jgi:pimeloyl-ACP methyl ester carboxylesterase
MDVSGVRLHYAMQGDGPPLVLLHGVAASLHTWDGWVRELAPHYRVIRIDLPGCGLSDPLRERAHYTPEYTLQFLERVCVRLGLSRFHLAGNSLGGFFSWYYAAHHPERIDKLVLLSPIAYPQALPPLLALLALWGVGDAARFVSPRFAVAQGVRMVYGDPRAVSAELIDRYHALASRGRNRHALVETLRRIKLFAKDPQLSLHVRKIRAPTLLMWGAQDRLVPSVLIDSWRRDVAQLEVKLYPRAGHIPMEELPEETARDAHAFLSR